MSTSDREISERSGSLVAEQSSSPGERTLEEIGEDECFALLAGQDLGRLAVVRDGQPEIFPVNYAIDGHTITIRTQPGIKLTYASLARIAFEVEEIDPVSREGWVVVVLGLGQDITDAIDSWSEHARNAGARPWVAGLHADDHHIAIANPQISGRRLSRPTTMPTETR